MRFGLRIVNASLESNFGITTNSPIATQIACSGVNNKPSSIAAIWTRNTGFSLKQKTIIIFVQIKKSKNSLNCVFQANFLLKPGIQILKESANNLGQPANCPICVEINAAVPDNKKRNPPTGPHLDEKRFDSFKPTCGPSGAI